MTPNQNQYVAKSMKKQSKQAPSTDLPMDELWLTSGEAEKLRRINEAWDTLHTVTGLALIAALLGTERFELYMAAATSKRRLQLRIYGESESVTLSA
jgi:hypothetical protein